MAASLVGALVEKFGAIQLPLRDLGLNDYLLGRHDINSGFMQERVQRIIQTHSASIRSGGVSMMDRDSQDSRPLADILRVEKQLAEFKSATFENIEELYAACRRVYGNAVVYKPVTGDPGMHVEYPTDFGKNHEVAERLYESYVDSFKDVRMIHMHREFDGWINSLASQKFQKPHVKDKFKFKIRNMIRNYNNYEDAVSKLPGLHLKFDELFDGHIEELAEKVRNSCDLPEQSADLRKETYDLYGKPTPYEKAFKPFDDERVYLDHPFRGELARYAKSSQNMGIVREKMVWARYLWCLFKYQSNRILA